MKIEDMSLDQLMQKLKALNESVAMQVMHSIDAALADLVEHCEKEKPETMSADAIVKGLAAALAGFKPTIQVNVPAQPAPIVHIAHAQRGFRLIPKRGQYGGLADSYDFQWLPEEAPKP